MQELPQIFKYLRNPCKTSLSTATLCNTMHPSLFLSTILLLLLLSSIVHTATIEDVIASNSALTSQADTIDADVVDLTAETPPTEAQVRIGSLHTSSSAFKAPHKGSTSLQVLSDHSNLDTASASPPFPPITHQCHLFSAFHSRPHTPNFRSSDRI